jgi:hypothetical protein
MIRFIFAIIATVLVACSGTKSEPKALPLTGAWFANAQSINFLNLQRMALDLRADSTYRYYYLTAPTPPREVGDEFTEVGSYRVRGDSLLFTTEVVNGNNTIYDYSRKYRLLSDTTDWPLRIGYIRQGTPFEVYFQIPE